VALAEFDRIITHGDGAVGMQISQPVGTILVRPGIETFGSTGESLVKGVETMLPAIGLSVKSGGSIRHVCIHGGLHTHGTDVLPIELQGAIDTIHIGSGCGADAPDANTLPVQA
jgi:hypothetical protein